MDGSPEGGHRGMAGARLFSTADVPADDSSSVLVPRNCRLSLTRGKTVGREDNDDGGGFFEIPSRGYPIPPPFRLSIAKVPLT